MRKYKLISALAEETAKDVVRNEEMHCWVNKGAKGIELIDKLPDIFGQGVEIDNSEVVQTARRAKELLDKLAEYKSVSFRRRTGTADYLATAELKQYQSEPSPKEILETIPLLTIDDIRREAEPIYNKELSEHEIPILQHEIETNGIAYVDMLLTFIISPLKMSLILAS